MVFFKIPFRETNHINAQLDDLLQVIMKRNLKKVRNYFDSCDPLKFNFGIMPAATRNKI